MLYKYILGIKKKEAQEKIVLWEERKRVLTELILSPRYGDWIIIYKINVNHIYGM